MDESLFSNRLLVVDNEPALGPLVKTAAQAAGFEVVFTNKPPKPLFSSPFTNAQAWRRRKIVARQPQIRLASLAPLEVTA